MRWELQRTQFPKKLAFLEVLLIPSIVDTWRWLLEQSNWKILIEYFFAPLIMLRYANKNRSSLQVTDSPWSSPSAKVITGYLLILMRSTRKGHALLMRQLPRCKKHFPDRVSPSYLELINFNKSKNGVIFRNYPSWFTFSFWQEGLTTSLRLKCPVSISH